MKTSAMRDGGITPVVIKQSEALWERALRTIPCGTQCYSKGPSYYSKGSSPIYLRNGNGCRVWDVDGNEYIDLGMGLWAVTLGHNYRPHVEAVTRALENGTQFTLMHPLEVELAEAMVDIIPAAEMVRFGKNGSDVTTAAVRLARTYTGRDVILRSGYHGWHDWYIAGSEHDRGIPEFNRSLTGRFDDGDKAEFDRLMDQHDGRVAAVIMEGIQTKAADRSFLHHVRARTKTAGTLLVFDEVVNGYRFGVGGAHEFEGIDVDLATFGKGMANGTPMAALVGKKEFMKHLERAFFSLTFGGETMGLSAALEVLKIYRKENVVGALRGLGDQLYEAARQAIFASGLEAWIGLSAYGQRTIWTFQPPYAGCDALHLKSLLQQELIRRRILWAGWHALCFSLALDQKAQQRIVQAYGESLEVVARQVADRRVVENLQGEMISPIFKRH